MTDHIGIENFGSIPGDTFELKEATELINREVIAQEDQTLLPSPPIAKIGLIVGVLWVNDEVELIIRLGKKLAQVTKYEFEENFVFIPE